MTNILARIIDSFKPRPLDEVIDNRLRKRELDKVRQYCKSQSLEFYPEELTRLPFFVKEANRYIEERARRDLPIEQFEDRLKFHDLSKWVEIGGVLGHNDNLFEMSYSEPDPNNVSLEVRLPTGVTVPQKVWVELYGGNSRDARVISSSTSMHVVSKEDLEKAKYLVNWHTHHVGFGEMSEGDALHINEFVQECGVNKQVYFVVFRPAKNQSVWYQAKKV